MAPQLTLYGTDGSCSLAVHTLLNVLSLPHNVVAMKFGPDGLAPADGSLTAAEYRKIHPSSYVPGFKVTSPNGTETSITEMPAILSYIGSLVPSRELLGKDALESARIISWLAWLSGTVHGWGYGGLLAPKRFVGADSDESLKDVVKANGKDKILWCYDRIEATIGEGHAVGGRLTVVDVNLIIFWTPLDVG